MNCFDIQERIIDMLLGELSPEDEFYIRQHLESCPMCRSEFLLVNECLKTCTEERADTCECQFQNGYWNDFIVTVHERISHEKRESVFPYRIVVPIAASVIVVLGLGYFFFLRPSPQTTVQEKNAPYYEYDPYGEMDDLTPEETEEFIKMIQQKYPE